MTWLGLDIGLLMLSVTGFVSDDPVTRRTAYLSMNMIGDTLLVPASLLALATGVLLGIGTPWGLVRYRWVLTKLVVTIITATLTIFALRDGLHEAAAGVLADPPSPGEAGVGLLAAPLVSLTCYIGMTALSVFKPWGRTRWGRRPAASA
ncbi:membrane protein [Actinomadura viridis]